jgi:predicted O-methyltransferase YrrM
MEFISEEILKYAESHSEPEPEVLKELNRETHLKILMPRMLSGHLQGRVLSLFSKMVSPKRILEIGTYTGYSAICLSEGLRADGILTTIDINAELEDMAREYFSKAGISNKIEYIIGNALEIIPLLKENYDLVFIDADKINYGKYFDLVIDKVNVGGLIIADNVLWSGKILEEYDKSDKDTKALMDFNKKTLEDKRVETLLLPIRDGLIILRKI